MKYFATMCMNIFTNLFVLSEHLSQDRICQHFETCICPTKANIRQVKRGIEGNKVGVYSRLVLHNVCCSAHGKKKKMYMYMRCIKCFLFVLWHGASCTPRWHFYRMLHLFFFFRNWLRSQRLQLCVMFSENAFLKRNTLSGIFMEHGRQRNRSISPCTLCTRSCCRRHNAYNFRRPADFQCCHSAMTRSVFHASRVAHYLGLGILNCIQTWDQRKQWKQVPL